MARKAKAPSQRATRPTKKDDQLLLRLKNDLPFYAKTCLKITTKGAQLVPLVLNHPQQVVHDKLAEQAREKGYVKAIVLKARQEGISTYVAARFFRRFNLFKNQKAMIVAHQQRPASVLFEIYDRYHRNIPEGLIDPRRYGEKGLRLLLENDSQIEVQTANNVHGSRGSTVHLLHASEVAFWEKPEDTFNSLAQTVPDEGSEIILESTANGVGNFFHQKWEAATAGDDDYIAIFLPWWIYEDYTVQNLSQELRDDILNSTDPFERKAQDEGIEWESEFHKLKPEQLAWRRRTIRNKHAGNELQFRQEYPATAHEAFIVSGNCFFDPEKLEEYQKGIRPPIFRGNFVTDGSGFRFVPNERGYVRIWEMPDTSRIYAIGADTASGRQVSQQATEFSDPESERGGRDFSCADVVDVDSGLQVAQLHGRMDPKEFSEQLRMLGYFYGAESHSGGLPAAIGVERNHWSGETVLKLLQQDHHYPNLYYSRQEGRRFNKPTPVLGWVTSSATRGPLLDGLAMAVREFAIEIPCAETIKEMFTFVRAEDGKPQAQESCHDDRVLALAIAWQIARSPGLTRKASSLPPPEPVGSSPTGWASY